MCQVCDQSFITRSWGKVAVIFWLCPSTKFHMKYVLTQPVFIVKLYYINTATTCTQQDVVLTAIICRIPSLFYLQKHNHKNLIANFMSKTILNNILKLVCCLKYCVKSKANFSTRLFNHYNNIDWQYPF